MARLQYVTGIDIGSTKVCSVIADLGHESGPRLLGYGRAASAGMQRGAVVDLAALGRALSESVDIAERTAGQKIDGAFFGVADEHIQSFNRRGMVTMNARMRTIGQSHVARAVESTMTLDLDPGQEVLHFVPHSFCVDGRLTVQNPLGMQGRRLEVATHVVTGATTSVLNTMRAIHQHGLEIDELVVGPLAAAEAVLTAEERRAGVMLIDIGGETTDVVIFTDGGAVYTGVFGLGGARITSDLAIGLKTPLQLAEQVKLRAGRCIAAGLGVRDTVGIPAFDGGHEEQVPLGFLAEICQARMEEIFETVMDGVADSGFRAPLPGGVVLTGGGSSLRGIVDLARRQFELPARLGMPTGVADDGGTLRDPATAVATGLVLWGMRNGHPDQRGREEQRWRRATRWMGSCLRRMLP